MRIGVIARPETHRGLGIQCREFVRHMPVSKILQVDFPHVTGPRENYVGMNVMRCMYDTDKHTLSQHVVVDFLEGLDVVFCAETPYDWDVLKVARQMGVKTVIQGNPEFIRQGQPGYEHYGHPDEWWWPTTWRLDKLPPGRVVPVPMPTPPATLAAEQGQPRLRVVHVAGKRALADRNGTMAFMQALRSTREQMDVLITSVDEEPIVALPMRNVRLTTRVQGFDNRWEAYWNRHVLVLPRRYGGLCLPALEAMAAGLAVAMPEMTPNTDWPIHRLIPERFEDLWMAGGHIDAAVINPQKLAFQLDTMAVAMQRGELDMTSGRERTLWWDDGGRELYIDLLEDVCAG